MSGGLFIVKSGVGLAVSFEEYEQIQKIVDEKWRGKTVQI
jgi:hypothetical protein